MVCDNIIFSIGFTIEFTIGMWLWLKMCNGWGKHKSINWLKLAGKNRFTF